ncbi:MAG: hypothetical protein HUJ74_01105 [Lachnospiraceae bacterium]|nr:hypothetical protein [Lachnospiraceae bacterium]
MEEQIRKKLEANLLNKLKKDGRNLVSKLSLDSTRAIGDAVQSFVEQHFSECIPTDILNEYEDDFSRRSMQDLAFSDNDGNYYAIDVKTHNTSTDFNMPNLTSVHRLAKFYRNKSNYFCILMVTYNVEDGNIEYTNCQFRPIEHFNWSCLTLGALGWGQIQFKNSNDIKILPAPSRKDWMIKMCEAIEAFYGIEISKINERIDWFKKEKEYWKNYK